MNVIKMPGMIAMLGAIIMTLSAAYADGENMSISTAEPDETIRVFVGQSLPLEMKWRIEQVSVTDPDIADIQTLSPTGMLLVGRQAGATNLIVWGQDEKLYRANVLVEVNLESMRKDLQDMFHGANIDIRQSQGVFVLTGRLEQASQIDRLRQFMTATDLPWVDMTTLPGLQQVQIQVRVAEVSRNAIRTMGFNAIKAGDDFFGGISVGSSGGGAIQPMSIGPLEGALDATFGVPDDLAVSPLVTLFAGFPGSELEFFLQALTENQYLRVLAEPNLVAMSGEKADFMAGGEFPIPIVQGGAGGQTSISIEYKPFGVLLSFLPTVLGEDTIRLNVDTEVSELTDVGSVTVQGFHVPSLVTRRTQTTVEMKNGQTFALAGLLMEKDGARNSRIPGLGDVPVLGTLFRSVRYENNETELAVLVTARLTQPLSLSRPLPVPGDDHRPPNDWELFFLGRLEGSSVAGETGGAEMPAAPGRAVWLRQQGLDELTGPGAWASHDLALDRRRPQANAGSTAVPAAMNEITVSPVD